LEKHGTTPSREQGGAAAAAAPGDKRMEEK